MSFNYSVMLNVESKPVLVVGGGTVAKRKIKDLLTLKAKVTVIAPSILEDIRNFALTGSCQCLQRPFELSDIETFHPFIVFAATDNFALNREITNYCNTRQILVNSITEPSEGSLSVQATIRKPMYAVSVSTYGQGPGFSKALKEHLQTVLNERFDLVVQLYIDIRQWLFATYTDSDVRINYLRKLTFQNLNSLMNDEALEYDQLLEKVKRMAILLIGLNHKSAPVEVREKVSLSRPQIEKLSKKIRQVQSFSGCTILSTCNRTEYYVNADSPFAAQEALIDLICGYSGIKPRELAPYLYIKFNKHAVEHLFSVAAGLDSMILGESQIQGQVQDAYEYALNYGISDNILNTLFMNALTVGKRVRTETQIDRHTLSISIAAVEIAKDYYGGLTDKTILVLGAGETSELTSRYLISNGAQSIMVANRTFERAEWLAGEIGGRAVNFTELAQYLPDADLIISSTASPVPIIDKEVLLQAQSNREKPLLMIDIAVPRDFHPNVAEMPYVKLFDIDDMSRKTDENLVARQQETAKAQAIVNEELEDFYFWLDSLWVVPTIVKMREQIAKIKESEIERAIHRIDNPSDREIRIIEQLANSIVNRWLHQPIINMKSLAGKRADKIDCYINAINDLWGLNDDDKKVIKVGSRDSQLALWQTKYAIEELKKVFTDYEFEIVSMKTKGDKILDVSLSKIGDKGLFTNELESMMLSGEVDMAVHSLKDMPTSLPEGLSLSCFLERYDHRDALLTKHSGGIMELPKGAIVGTSSLRRRSQLLAMRPDLQVKDLRGNVNTRLRKYHEEDFDAVILAVAGLERLDFHDEISEHLDDQFFVPAVGQGALVIEARTDREDLNEKFALVNDDNTTKCVFAERQFMCALDGGCQVPMGAYAQINGDEISIHGFVGAVDGSVMLKDTVTDSVENYEKIGEQLAKKLLEKGAKNILDTIRN